MTAEQWAQLLNLLGKIAERQYTLTQASDWPILATMGGVIAALIAFMWVDLRGSMKDGKSEWRQALAEHTATDRAEHEKMWQSQRDCQADCCPRGAHVAASREHERV